MGPLIINFFTPLIFVIFITKNIVRWSGSNDWFQRGKILFLTNHRICLRFGTKSIRTRFFLFCIICVPKFINVKNFRIKQLNVSPCGDYSENFYDGVRSKTSSTLPGVLNFFSGDVFFVETSCSWVKSARVGAVGSGLGSGSALS